MNDKIKYIINFEFLVKRRRLVGQQPFPLLLTVDYLVPCRRDLVAYMLNLPTSQAAKTVGQRIQW